MANVAWALSGLNLIRFDPSNPSIDQTTKAISGIASGETLVGIDFRPQNGFLYTLGVNASADTATLYVISLQTGVASIIGTQSQISFTTNGTTAIDLPDPTTVGYGFDFDPVADSIRVTAGSLNFRINPNTGSPVDGNNGGGATAGTNPDGPLGGGTTTIQSAAYTNNQPYTTVTTLYTLDASSHSLFIQNSPNSGNQTNGQIVTLGGNPLNFSGVNGFDIAAGVNAASSNTAVSSGSGLALLNVGGQTGFYSINLATGAATFVGNFLDGATAASGFAIQSDLGGVPAIAVSPSGQALYRFMTQAPNFNNVVSLSGLISGDAIAGIDYRPSTGQLFAFGVNSTTDTGTLYLLDPQTGVLSVVGSASQVAFTTDGTTPVDLASAGYGVDFDPVSDRLRITTDSGPGLNFRINPVTGAPVDGNNGTGSSVPGTNPDGAINGLPAGSTGISATAYASSTQFTLDAASNSLFVQTPSNSGTQTSQLVVKSGGTVLDFFSTNGFDISSSVTDANIHNPDIAFGYAALNARGYLGLYKVSLVTGEATFIGFGASGVSLKGLAVGNTVDALVKRPASDFDGDYHSDILWRHDSGVVSIYQMNGTTIKDNSFVSQPSTDWKIQGVGDFNGDGRSDILWRHDSGVVSIYEMNGTTIQDNSFVSQPSTDWKIQGVGDFNGDGRSDILWRHDSGVVSIYEMNGTNIVGGGYVSQPGNDWKIQGVGDFNDDGRSDILWRHDSGVVSIYQMNGTTIQDNSFVSQPSTDWKIQGVGDFNGDGHSDILWRHVSGVVSIYEMNGTNIVGGGYVSQPGNDWAVQKVADYNDDGHADILWRHDSGVVSEYLMNGTSIIGGGYVSQPDHDWIIQ